MEERLVSSAATNVTSFRTERARRVISFKLPIGDPTIKSIGKNSPPFGEKAHELDGGILDGERDCLVLLNSRIISNKEACRTFYSPLTHDLGRVHSFDPELNIHPQIKFSRSKHISLE